MNKKLAFMQFKTLPYRKALCANFKDLGLHEYAPYTTYVSFDVVTVFQVQKIKPRREHY